MSKPKALRSNLDHLKLQILRLTLLSITRLLATSFLVTNAALTKQKHILTLLCESANYNSYNILSEDKELLCYLKIDWATCGISYLMIESGNQNCGQSCEITDFTTLFVFMRKSFLCFIAMNDVFISSKV